MTKKLLNILLLTLLTASGLVLGSTSQVGAADASNFQAGSIINNQTFNNNGSMSAQQIQNFLINKGSTCLKDFKSRALYDHNNDNLGDEPYGDKNGDGDIKDSGEPVKVSAAKLIKQASNIYNLNPRVIIVTLQKEQGLVTRSDCPDWRYQTAMGFGCPDSEPCDKSAYGFTRQIDYGAYHFRGYYNDSLSYVPYSTGEHSIDYHPDDSCGSSKVLIQNEATASLYSYTPYQPNQAALNNLYGTGNGCSSYGNRNFWRYFTDWFHNPSPGSQILLLKKEGGSKTYLIRDNTKVHISGPSIMKAWGFNNLSVVTVDESTINKYRNSAHSLRRFGADLKNDKRFFVDSRKGYQMGEKSANVWEFSMEGMPYVGHDVIQYLESRQRLPYLVKSPVGPEVYMMDKGKLRHYPSPTILNTWEVNTASASISEGYFCEGSTSGDSCDFRWPEGSKLKYPKVSSPETPKIFFVNQGNKHHISSTAMSGVYPGSTTSVSQATLDRLFDAPKARALLTTTYESKIYLLDKQKYHHIGGPTTFNHWKPNGDGRKTTVSGAFLNLLTKGEGVGSLNATDGSQTYYMDQSKHLLDAKLNDVYAAAHEPLEVSTAVLNLYSDKTINTPFVTSKKTPRIFLLNGSGTKHHIGSPSELKIIKGDKLKIKGLPHGLLKNMPAGSGADFQFKVGSGTYVFDNGAFHKVISNEWQLNPFFELASASLDWFESKTDLGSHFRQGSKYGVARNSTAYTTGNSQLGTLWDASNSSPIISKRLVAKIGEKSLSPLVGSTNPDNPRLYIYDGQDLFYIPNIATLKNLNPGRFGNKVRLTDSEINSLDGDSATYILNDSAGTMDNGQRRHFRNTDAAGEWVTLSNEKYDQKLVDLLSQNTNPANVSKLITSPKTNKYFCIEDGEKRWLTGPSSIDGSSCEGEPLRGISHKLLRQIPTGPNI